MRRHREYQIRWFDFVSRCVLIFSSDSESGLWYSRLYGWIGIALMGFDFQNSESRFEAGAHRTTVWPTSSLPVMLKIINRRSRELLFELRNVLRALEAAPPSPLETYANKLACDKNHTACSIGVTGFATLRLFATRLELCAPKCPPTLLRQNSSRPIDFQFDTKCPGRTISVRAAPSYG